MGLQASQIDSVLIEQVVYLASKARVATGQEPIFDIPKGGSAATTCPIARALNLDCAVTGTTIQFKTLETAQQVAGACGLPVPKTVFVSVPVGHPFKVFVNRFDAGGTKHMKQLKK
jgi:hypothetical protein